MNGPLSEAEYEQLRAELEQPRLTPWHRRIVFLGATACVAALVVGAKVAGAW